MKFTTCLLLASGLACLPASAQDQPPLELRRDFPTSGGNALGSEAGIELLDDSSVAAMPEPQMRGDVTWMCGGIGEEEADYMKQQAKGYDLMLTFAARDGTYLADVGVEISDAKGKPVLQAACGGPIMLVDLPAGGRYAVRAVAAGNTIDRTVNVATVNSRTRNVAAVLHWPQQVAEGQGEAQTSSGASGGMDRRGDGASGAR